MRQPEEKHEKLVRIAEHEVLLAFVNDDDADLFREWLCAEGMAAFQGWIYGRYSNAPR